MTSYEKKMEKALRSAFDKLLQSNPKLTSVVCPVCNAQIGQWCKHADGVVVGGLLGEHAERMQLIKERKNNGN